MIAGRHINQEGMLELIRDDWHDGIHRGAIESHGQSVTDIAQIRADGASAVFPVRDTGVCL